MINSITNLCCSLRVIGTDYQAIMHFNTPKDKCIENLDQLTIENDKLNFHSYMRSNDIIYGRPYNLAYFKVILEKMLDYLNAECGHKLEMGYIHRNATSIHLYKDKYCKKIILE